MLSGPSYGKDACLRSIASSAYGSKTAEGHRISTKCSDVGRTYGPTRPKSLPFAFDVTLTAHGCHPCDTGKYPALSDRGFVERPTHSIVGTKPELRPTVNLQVAPVSSKMVVHKHDSAQTKLIVSRDIIDLELNALMVSALLS